MLPPEPALLVPNNADFRVASVSAADRTISRRSGPNHSEVKHDERCARLAEAPGGPADRHRVKVSLDNAQRFKNGRELSAYLGLVPACTPRAARLCGSGLPSMLIAI